MVAQTLVYPLQDRDVRTKHGVAPPFVHIAILVALPASLTGSGSDGVQLRNIGFGIRFGGGRDLTQPQHGEGGERDGQPGG